MPLNPLHHAKSISAALLALGLVACAQPAQNTQSVATSAPIAGTETVVFAGGCFWCVESDFDKVDGVLETISGYTGGGLENPTYEQVSHTETGHYEAVQIRYDPAQVSYETLVDYFFRHVDPTDAGGQFCDRGSSYRTAIFAGSEEEIEAAQAIKDGFEASGDLPAPIVTPIIPATTFWPAEDYHQDYYQKNPIRYRYYRNACRRDARVAEVWQNAPPALH